MSVFVCQTTRCCIPEDLFRHSSRENVTFFLYGAVHRFDLRRLLDWGWSRSQSFRVIRAVRWIRIHNQTRSSISKTWPWGSGASFWTWEERRCLNTVFLPHHTTTLCFRVCSCIFDWGNGNSVFIPICPLIRLHSGNCFAVRMMESITELLKLDSSVLERKSFKRVVDCVPSKVE